MTPKIKKVNYYGFDHKKVAKEFEGDLTFVNEFCVRGEYNPVAVYRAENPNVKKGHKKFMLLQTNPNNGHNGGLVRGMSEKAMEKERYQHALLCEKCNTVIYSINRHHCHKCGCDNETMVDGGKDYMRAGGRDLNLIKTVTLDLLTDQVVDNPQILEKIKKNNQKNT